MRHASYLRRIGSVCWKSSDVYIFIFGLRLFPELCYRSVQSTLCSGNESDMGSFTDELLS